MGYNEKEKEYILKLLNERYYRTLDLSELKMINVIFEKLGKAPEQMFMSAK